MGVVVALQLILPDESEAYAINGGAAIKPATIESATFPNRFRSSGCFRCAKRISTEHESHKEKSND
jgi:hypothetical protein